MTIKRCLLIVGLLIAVAFLGLYAARATSVLASEVAVKKTEPSATALGSDVAGPALQNQDACQAEGGSSPDAKLTPVSHSCDHCTTTANCIALGCGGPECDPVCVPWGGGKRCICQ